MAQRLDISQINISGILVLILLGALIAAAVIDPPSDNRVPKITAEDRRVTAIHESGHAVLAANLPAGGHILEITIESSWGILGSVTRAPAADGLGAAERRARSMAELIIAQGGLIAEEIILLSDEPSDEPSGEPGGARTSDIIAAEKIAFELLGGPDANLAPAEIDAGVRRLMDGAERRARDILGDQRGALMRLAAALLDSGTLSGGQVSVILAGGNE